MNIDVERVDFGPGLQDLANEWEELLRRSSRPTIYSSFDYVYTSCSHFVKGAEIFFLLFREAEQGRLLAIYPVSIWKDKVLGISLRRVEHGTPAAASQADKPYPIIDRDSEDACWKRFSDYFRNEFRSWDLMAYDELWMESRLKHDARALFPVPAFLVKTRPGPDSPIFALDGNWEDFWNAHHHIRTKNRRIDRQLGDRLSFTVTGDPKEVDACLDAYIVAEQASEKARGGIMRPETQQFYRELFPKLAAKGQLYFAVMKDGDTIVAVHVSYVFLNRVYFALCTFNPEYRKLSPGLVMHSRFIRFFYGKGYSEGDFLAGYAGYMDPWATYSEKSANIQIWKMGSKTGYVAARKLIGRIRDKGKHRVKSTTQRAEIRS